MFCKQCGREVEQTQEFCGYCGQKLTLTASPKTDEPQSGGSPPKKRIKKRDFVRCAVGNVPLYLTLLDVAFCPLFVITTARFAIPLFSLGYDYVTLLKVADNSEMMTAIDHPEMVSAMLTLILVTLLQFFLVSVLYLTALTVAYNRRSVVLSAVMMCVYGVVLFSQFQSGDWSDLLTVIVFSLLTIFMLLFFAVQVLLHVEYVRKAHLCETLPKSEKPSPFGKLKWFLLIAATVLLILLMLLWGLLGSDSESVQEPYGAASPDELRATLASEYCFTQDQVSCMTAPMYAWLVDECTDSEIESRADEAAVRECNEYLFDVYDEERVKIVIHDLKAYDGQDSYTDDALEEVRYFFGEYVYTLALEEKEAIEGVWTADYTLIGESGDSVEVSAEDDDAYNDLLVYCIDGRYYWSLIEMY